MYNKNYHIIEMSKNESGELSFTAAWISKDFNSCPPVGGRLGKV